MVVDGRGDGLEMWLRPQLDVIKDGQCGLSNAT
jgi:hypothetical protein